MLADVREWRMIGRGRRGTGGEDGGESSACECMVYDMVWCVSLTYTIIRPYSAGSLCFATHTHTRTHAHTHTHTHGHAPSRSAVGRMASRILSLVSSMVDLSSYAFLCVSVLTCTARPTGATDSPGNSPRRQCRRRSGTLRAPLLRRPLNPATHNARIGARLALASRAARLALAASAFLRGAQLLPGRSDLAPRWVRANEAHAAGRRGGWRRWGR